MTLRLSTLCYLALLSACSVDGTAASSAEPTERSAPSDGARVEVAEVQHVPAELRMGLTGEIKGLRDANLASSQGGFVEAVSVRTGAEVRKGQTLMTVDRQLHAAGYAQAKAQSELAAAEFARLRRMGDAVSASQLQQAETQAKVTEAGLAQARVQLSRASIVAPFDGVVSAVNIEEGEIAPPGNGLLRVVQLDPVRVMLAVSDREVVALEEDLPVVVTASAIGQQLEGRIRQISPVGDGRTRSFQVEVEVPNPDRKLLPGMVARVELSRMLGEHIVVPSDWIVSTPGGYGVFVEVDGSAKWRPVELGRVLRNQVVVEGGLSPGDAVIMVGHRELIDGDSVLVSRRGVCCDRGRVQYEALGGS